MGKCLNTCKPALDDLLCGLFLFLALTAFPPFPPFPLFPVAYKKVNN
jgi:hypothetical protein